MLTKLYAGLLVQVQVLFKRITIYSNSRHIRFAECHYRHAMARRKCNIWKQSSCVLSTQGPGPRAQGRGEAISEHCTDARHTAVDSSTHKKQNNNKTNNRMIKATFVSGQRVHGTSTRCVGAWSTRRGGRNQESEDFTVI